MASFKTEIIAEDEAACEGAECTVSFTPNEFSFEQKTEQVEYRRRNE